MSNKARLKELRQSLKLSQREFSEYFNIPKKTLQGWEATSTSKAGVNPPDYLISLLEKVIAYETKGEQLSIFKKINQSEININDLIPKKKYYVLHTMYVSGQEFYKIYTPTDPNFEADVNFMKEQDKKGYKYSPTWETFEVYHEYRCDKTTQGEQLNIETLYRTYVKYENDERLLHSVDFRENEIERLESWKRNLFDKNIPVGIIKTYKLIKEERIK